MKFFRILFVLAITSSSSVYGDTTSGNFIEIEEESHKTYTSDYTDDPVRMSVLSGEYKLYGNFEIQDEGKVRLTVDDATSFSLTDLNVFQIESFGENLQAMTAFGSVPNTGHKTYTSDYTDDFVRMRVLSGEYKLYDNLELQPGAILELTVNGSTFTLHSIDHFKIEGGFDYDTDEPTGACIVTASNGFSQSFSDHSSSLPEISDVTWIRFEAVDAKVHTYGYEIPGGVEINGGQGACIVTASNGFSQSFSDYSPSLPEISDVTWIDFESTNAKVHTDGYSITYTTADTDDGDGDGEEEAYLSLFKQINSDGKNGISRKEWREYKKEDEPEVTSGNMRFRDVDENNNQKIGKGEFKKFYERLIKD